jgi:hypothetical protein
VGSPTGTRNGGWMKKGSPSRVFLSRSRFWSDALFLHNSSIHYARATISRLHSHPFITPKKINIIPNASADASRGTKVNPCRFVRFKSRLFCFCPPIIIIICSSIYLLTRQCSLENNSFIAKQSCPWKICSFKNIYYIILLKYCLTMIKMDVKIKYFICVYKYVKYILITHTLAEKLSTYVMIYFVATASHEDLTGRYRIWGFWWVDEGRAI